MIIVLQIFCVLLLLIFILLVIMSYWVVIDKWWYYFGMSFFYGLAALVVGGTAASMTVAGIAFGVLMVFFILHMIFFPRPKNYDKRKKKFGIYGYIESREDNITVKIKVPVWPLKVVRYLPFPVKIKDKKSGIDVNVKEAIDEFFKHGKDLTLDIDSPEAVVFFRMSQIRIKSKEACMSEEKKMILEMVKEGKISVEEAEKLLDKVDADRVSENTITCESDDPNKKFLRVRVIDGGETNVNINIPIALAGIGLKFIPKDKLNLNGQEINIEQILQLIDEGAEGELANIDVNENGKITKVKIYID